MASHYDSAKKCRVAVMDEDQFYCEAGKASGFRGGTEASVVPSGLGVGMMPGTPGLAPWAILLRPYGAL